MQGTFKTCSKCNEQINCCMSFNKIDSPIINENEKLAIQYRTKCDDNLFTKIDGNCYNINTSENRCPFYKNYCTIYDIRPCDCKLYPYDIKKIDNKYYLICYKTECFKENIIKEPVDDIIEQIRPFINEFTSNIYNKKLNSVAYQIIKELQIYRDFHPLISNPHIKVRIG